MMIGLNQVWVRSKNVTQVLQMVCLQQFAGTAIQMSVQRVQRYCFFFTLDEQVDQKSTCTGTFF